MENLRYLLAAIAALTLIMSVVSTVNPGYFAGLNALADDDDFNGGSNDDNEHDEEDDERDDEDDQDDVSEEDDDKGKGKDDDGKMAQSLGNNSKVELEIDDDEAELNVEIEDGDLDDGTYDVIFTCESPDVDEDFAGELEVEDGEGEFKEDLSLTNGTYSGCEVEVGGLNAAFASFTIAADKDDADDRKDRESELKKEFKLDADEDGVEIEIEVEGLSMEDGSFDAVFACEAPAFNVTLGDAFEVEGGEGELEETIGLANGTYSGCEITVEGTTLASFKAFTISEETEDEQEQKIEEKRKEKRERIINSLNGTAIHERHRSQNAASPGDYDPGWDYTLIAAGTAAHGANGTDADAEVDINMAVWKSNRAVILLDVLGGTVEIENQIYTVVLGYALYTTQHDVFRVSALAADDDGNVFKLKLRGSAVDGDAEFPAESGSIELEFGSSGSADRLGDWELTIDGTVTAG